MGLSKDISNATTIFVTIATICNSPHKITFFAIAITTKKIIEIINKNKLWQ